MPNLTKEFIENVRQYREETGCLLKAAVKHVEMLILSGKVEFSKYDDPDIITANIKPAIKLLVGDVITIGYKNQYSAIVSSISINSEKEEVMVSLSCIDKTYKEKTFSFEDFVRMSYQ